MSEHTNPTTLQYHLYRDPQYSIAYMDDNIDRAKSRRRELADDPTVDVIGAEIEVNGTAVYHIYTKNDPEAYLEFGDEYESLDQWIESLSEDDFQFLQLVYDAFDGVLDTVEADDSELELYKRMEHRKLVSIPNEVEWKQSVATVGAELLSRFIQSHPMPNSNHRTAFGVVDRYFASYDASFAMPDTGEDQSWYQWAADYVFDSKRLITLRRKFRLLQRARECGYDSARRKDGAEIDLTAIDFSRDDQSSYYATKHNERTQEFIDRLLAKTGHEELQSTPDKGKSVFIDRLKAAD
jgi:prophage maintenance system killer protein